MNKSNSKGYWEELSVFRIDDLNLFDTIALGLKNGNRFRLEPGSKVMTKTGVTQLPEKDKRLISNIYFVGRMWSDYDEDSNDDDDTEILIRVDNTNRRSIIRQIGDILSEQSMK